MGQCFVASCVPSARHSTNNITVLLHSDALTRARNGDDHGEVHEGYYASQNEAPPLPLFAGMDDGPDRR